MHLSRQFDQRNGNDYYKCQIEALMKLRRHATRVPLA
jgi:hypothetical protein